MDYLCAEQAIKFFDDNSIPYSIKYHVCDALTCIDVARERGVKLSQVLKCMVGKGIDGIIYVMLIPGDKIVNIDKLRYAVGIKVNLLPSKELTSNFGLKIGAISPIQFVNMTKNGNVHFLLDRTVLNEESIDISAGTLNAGIQLKTNDLVSLINPTICDIVEAKNV